MSLSLYMSFSSSLFFFFFLLLSLVHAANDARACYASGSIAESIRMLQDMRRKAEQLERRLLTLTDDHSKNQVGCHVPSSRPVTDMWISHLPTHTTHPHDTRHTIIHYLFLPRFLIVVGSFHAQPLMDCHAFYSQSSLALSLFSLSTPLFSSFARTTQQLAPPSIYFISHSPRTHCPYLA